MHDNLNCAYIFQWDVWSRTICIIIYVQKITIISGTITLQYLTFSQYGKHNYLISKKSKEKQDNKPGTLQSDEQKINDS